MKKQKPTNQKLFNIVLQKLKEKGLVPDILDYSLSASKKIEISNYSWSLVGHLYFGTNEGIYLRMYIAGDIGNNKIEYVELGVFKTLDKSRDALYIMSKLHADFIYEANEYVNQHLDDFTWTGYDIDFYKNNKMCCGFTCSTKEIALKKLKQIHNYDYALLINNETKEKEKIEKNKNIESLS